jgi:hypothetical protein
MSVAAGFAVGGREVKAAPLEAPTPALRDRPSPVYTGARRKEGAMAMTAEAGQGAQLDVAIRRLERATAQLEQRLTHRLAEAGADAGGLFDRDRAQLAADLDACRGRQRELEEAGAQASDALAGAIAQIRAILDEKAA